MAKGGYEFFLGKCLLPVAPSKLEIKINNANKTLALINEGEINILKKPGLTDIEFTCGIPQVRYPYAVYKEGFRGADYFLDYFESLKNSRKPFQFIVCRVLPSDRKLFNTNIKVTLEDYKLTEDAGDGFDVTVKVKLKQWRDYGTKTVNITMAASKPRAAAEPQRESTTSPAPAQAASYTVVKGDCLWNIAKKFYGNGSKYTVIYNANKGVIGGNPNLIYPEQVLTIPAA
ncbi:MAG: LysM peptidoglycan-binding domain-containing protein [Lachnospiraceae bacterium]|uniref:LysM peptidoglycan-binding domain-containing protein n=1 Tax=uncultured Acetatifactor sp. TaxID=1671927 RepID=UPI00260257E6|nr:LysM peptidoglycan-binding domain-containing protein [uncultured Acetatifactor sp.]MCI8788300.1 LysM peptidoglycan-binding domain-containing protein [Lachnospiraceae bacterium]